MMNEKKWTPGPWRAITAPLCDENYPDDCYWIQAIDPTGFHSIAEVRPGCDEALDEGDFEANAHLIAAAPELYEALRECLNYIENTENWMGEALDCGDAARAALAKARGEA